MPAGVQVFDASGGLRLDYTTRCGRMFGSVTTTAGVDGSVTNDFFLLGTPVWVAYKVGSGWRFPIITVVGDTLSWSYDGITTGHGVVIIYGVS